MSTFAPAEGKEAEPVAPPRARRLRRVQMYAGLGLALGVTIAWVILLLLTVWRVAELALDLVA